MKGNKVLKWIIIIVAAIILGVLSGMLSDILDLNRGTARSIILIFLLLGWYFVDSINKKKKQ